MLLAPLPDDARLWLFAADRPLTDEEQDALLDRMGGFAAGWTSHGRAVPAAVALVADRVLAVGASLQADALNAGISGCGIDALEHAVAAAADALGFGWLPALDVLYRADDGLRALSRPAFRALAREGAVDADTPVLDLVLSTVGALREKGVEHPAGDTWHGRVFRLSERTPAGG